MKRTLNIIASSIVIMFSVGLVGLTAFAIYSKQNTSVVSTTSQYITPKKAVNHDSNLYPLLQSVARDDIEAKNVSIVYVDRTSMDGQGEYQSDTDTIEVTHANSSLFKDIIAHEYLHHIFAKLSDLDRQSISSVAIQHYANDGGLRQRMQPYVDKNILSPDEITAVSCTEEADSWLPQSLLDYCNKYIVRSELTLMH